MLFTKYSGLTKGDVLPRRTRLKNNVPVDRWSWTYSDDLACPFLALLLIHFLALLTVIYVAAEVVSVHIWRCLWSGASLLHCV